MEEVKVSNDKKLDISNKEDQEQQKTEGNTIDQLNELLKDENIKSEYHRRIDLEVNKRLEKRLSKELEKAERERQAKEEQERQAKEEEKKIKQYEKEIEDLKKELEYRKVLESYNLPSELSKFVADEDKERTIKNIEFFLQVMDKYANEKIKEKLTENPPIPQKSEGETTNNKNKLWKF